MSMIIFHHIKKKNRAPMLQFTHSKTIHQISSHKLYEKKKPSPKLSPRPINRHHVRDESATKKKYSTENR